MDHDPIQCTRAYLTLWKLVDRLYPGSNWLEMGPIPHDELKANAQELSKRSNLTWCDEPGKLSEYAINVLALTRQQFEEGAILKADRLRSELRDQALKYAKRIGSNDSEWPPTFPWALQETRPRFRHG